METLFPFINRFKQAKLTHLFCPIKFKGLLSVRIENIPYPANPSVLHFHHYLAVFILSVPESFKQLDQQDSTISLCIA